MIVQPVAASGSEATSPASASARSAVPVVRGQHHRALRVPPRGVEQRPEHALTVAVLALEALGDVGRQRLGRERAKHDRRGLRVEGPAPIGEQLAHHPTCEPAKMYPTRSWCWSRCESSRQYCWRRRALPETRRALRSSERRRVLAIPRRSQSDPPAHRAEHCPVDPVWTLRARVFGPIRTLALRVKVRRRACNQRPCPRGGWKASIARLSLAITSVELTTPQRSTYTPVALAAGSAAIRCFSSDVLPYRRL